MNKEVSSAEVKEAHKWHKLFRQGDMTAHELSGLQGSDRPETTGEIFVVETENLGKIKDILDQDLSDEEFEGQLESMRAFLPRPFQQIGEAEQSSSHEEIVEHTVNSLRNLDTSNLDQRGRRIARATLVFHNVGQLEDPDYYDTEYPRRSAELSQDYLQKMGFEESDREAILNQIKWHDTLRDLANEWGGIMTHEDIFTIFPTEDDLAIHREIAIADATSIPELAEFVPRLKEEYDLLREQLMSRRKGSRTEIEEAYKWNDLFRKGYMTAHEISGLGESDRPETTGEIFVVETENLGEIKTILDEDLSDEEFRGRLEPIRDLLPRPFQQMEGVVQSPPHEWIDPVDHTINSLYQLDTSDLDQRGRRIARTTLIFHDVGKVEDPSDREHPRRSAELAQDYLQKMGFDESETETILNQIRWHDQLGDLANEWGKATGKSVFTIFPTEDDLAIHRQVAIADVGSIPGLAAFVPNLEAAYDKVKTLIESDSCVLEGETVIERDGKKAAQEIIEMLETEELEGLFVMPYIGVNARFIPASVAKDVLGSYAGLSGYSDLKDHDEIAHPIVYAQGSFRGVNGVFVQLAENGVQAVETTEGENIYYRYDTPEVFESMLEYGYYQVPLRECLFSRESGGDGWSLGRIQVAIRLKDEEVNKGRSGTYSLAGDDKREPSSHSLTLPESTNDVTLPDAVRDSFVEDLTFPRKRDPSISSKDLAKQMTAQVLQGGELLGILQRIDPDRIDIEKTLEINRARGKPEIMEQLEQIITRVAQKD